MIYFGTRVSSTPLPLFLRVIATPVLRRPYSTTTPLLFLSFQAVPPKHGGTACPPNRVSWLSVATAGNAESDLIVTGELRQSILFLAGLRTCQNPEGKFCASSHFTSYLAIAQHPYSDEGEVL